MSYITLTEAKEYLFTRGDAVDTTSDDTINPIDGWILQQLPAVDVIVDTHAGRSFPTTATATKYYDGSGQITQWIDPAASITSVSYLVDRSEDTWTALLSSEYYAWPYNTTPIEALVLDPSEANISHWPHGFKDVRVVGSFGYTTVPTAIQNAAKEVLRRMLLRSEQFRTLFYTDSLASGGSAPSTPPPLWDAELSEMIRDYTIRRMPYGY